MDLYTINRQAKVGDLAVTHDKWPLWQRVGWLAVSRKESNGHALFQAGELTRLLPSNGKPRTHQSINAAIKTAIEMDWLLPGSGARCLRPNPDLFDKGPGKPEKPCRVCDPDEYAEWRRLGGWQSKDPMSSVKTKKFTGTKKSRPVKQAGKPLKKVAAKRASRLEERDGACYFDGIKINRQRFNYLKRRQDAGEPLL